MNGVTAPLDPETAALVQEWRDVIAAVLELALAPMDEIDERVLNVAGELALT